MGYLNVVSRFLCDGDREVGLNLLLLFLLLRMRMLLNSFAVVENQHQQPSPLEIVHLRLIHRQKQA